MLAEVRTGFVQAGDGSVQPARAGRMGELLTNDAFGKYFQAAKDGMLFCASMQAGATFGTALTATAVTITLYNPTGSGVYLSLISTAVAMRATQTTTATAPVVVYAANLDPTAAIPATNTEIVTRPALLSVKVSAAKVYSATTLPATPIVIRVHPWGINQFTTNAAHGGSGAVDYVDGAIVLAENTAVTLQEIATTTASTLIASILWAEIPR